MDSVGGCAGLINREKNYLNMIGFLKNKKK